jgi:hypothetical protein
MSSKKRSFDKFTFELKENCKESRTKSKKTCSYNSDILKASGPSQSTTMNNIPTNQNLYQFEIISNGSQANAPKSVPIFSFWSQPKPFEWNFQLKTGTN